MKDNKKTLAIGGTLVTAALTGLFASSAFAEAPLSSGISSASVAAHSTFAGTQANHSIYANGSKHDCKGHNECKGQGGCKTGSDNGCKGQNSCKGKGGCSTAGE